MQELIKTSKAILKLCDKLKIETNKMLSGNNTAGQRARMLTLKLKALCKEFRALSIKHHTDIKAFKNTQSRACFLTL